MSVNFSPTNPGLTYDPRLRSTAKFFEALQKELTKNSKSAGKPTDMPSHRSKPVKDPGPASIVPMPNPRYTGVKFGR